MPTSSDSPPPPELSEEELDAIDDAWEKAQREGNPNVVINDTYTVRVVAGPSTKGMTLEIAGETFTLPDDAELGGFNVTSDPSYNIVRGDNLAQVFTSTGEFQIVEGERSDFQVLFDTFGEEKYRGTVNEMESGDCPPSGPGDSGGDSLLCSDESDSPSGPIDGGPGGDSGPTGNTGVAD